VVVESHFQLPFGSERAGEQQVNGGECRTSGAFLATYGSRNSTPA
jgi:hypothetical protein